MVSLPAGITAGDSEDSINRLNAVLNATPRLSPSVPLTLITDIVVLLGGALRNTHQPFPHAGEEEGRWCTSSGKISIFRTHNASISENTYLAMINNNKCKLPSGFLCLCI